MPWRRPDSRLKNEASHAGLGRFRADRPRQPCTCGCPAQMHGGAVHEAAAGHAHDVALPRAPRRMKSNGCREASSTSSWEKTTMSWLQRSRPRRVRFRQRASIADHDELVLAARRARAVKLARMRASRASSMLHTTIEMPSRRLVSSPWGSGTGKGSSPERTASASVCAMFWTASKSLASRREAVAEGERGRLSSRAPSSAPIRGCSERRRNPGGARWRGGRRRSPRRSGRCP